MREGIEAAAGLEEWRTNEIAEQVSIIERQVREHLYALQKSGYLEARHEERGFTWRDTGLHRVSDHGEVDLEPVDVEEVSESEIAEVTRNSIYTWEFRNPQLEHCGDACSTHTKGNEAIVGTGREPEEGGPPPG